MGSIVSGIFGNKAAKTQARAANNAAAIEAEQQRQNRRLFVEARDKGFAEQAAGLAAAKGYLEPLLSKNGGALAAYDYELGLGEAPENYAGFRETPGYQFARDEGLSAIANAYAARGQLNSGALEKARIDYASGLADQEYDNHLTRLSGRAQTDINVRGSLADRVQAYADNISNIAQGFATNSASSRTLEGQALAGGAIAAGNAKAAGQQIIGNIPSAFLNENLQVAGALADIGSKVANGASSFMRLAA